MRKLASALVIFVALLSSSLPGYAAENMGLTCEEFLTRLANVFFRVHYGYNSNQVMKTKRGGDSISLSYNNAVFMVVRVTPPPNEVENISVVCMTGQPDAVESLGGDGTPSYSVIFENICKQVMYALHKEFEESDAQSLMKELGMAGELLDGVQRSACFGNNRYIVKYNKNGMLIMVASSQ